MSNVNIIGPILQGEPLIDFVLCPTAAFVGALKRADPRASIPKPVKVRALIDTGFKGGLFIKRSLVADWGLKARNFSQVIGLKPDGEGYYDYYAWEADVAMRFEPPSARNVLIDPVPASMIELEEKGYFSAIIGCQILQMTTFVYDGPRRTLKFSFRGLR